MTIQLSVSIWTIICFLLLMLILRNLLFQPILEVMDARKMRIEKAAQKKAENEKRKNEYEAMLVEKEKVFYENVVQIGKVTDTPVVDENGNLTESAKVAIEVLEQYAKTFQERNPNLYLFNCVMHLDEATPHLHMDYIPVAHGYKTGLKKRNSLTKAFQEMGFAKAVSKKENETVAWQQRERNYLTELCKEHGIEVEMLGVQRENLSLPEYKSAMQKVAILEQQAEELHVQIEELEEKEQKNQDLN